MGLRAVTLGHAYEPVVEAAMRQMQRGTNFGRPAPIELECAERFLESVPTADMVKFCKDGSHALDGAVRLARAYTGRDLLAICGDHPFFSTSDWFIGSIGHAGRRSRLDPIADCQVSLQRSEQCQTIIRSVGGADCLRHP